MSILAKIFGSKSASVFEGQSATAIFPQVSVHVEGFEVAISSAKKPGEYTLSMRANGQNPRYPEEQNPKIFNFTKSDTQFSLAKLPWSCIARDNDYSRIVVGVVKVKSELWKECDMMPSSTNEVSIATYIRDKDGHEALWSIMGTECVLPKVPQHERKLVA